MAKKSRYKIHLRKCKLCKSEFLFQNMDYDQREQLKRIMMPQTDDLYSGRHFLSLH